MADIWSVKEIVQSAAAILQAAGSFSIVVAIFIYRSQRQATWESEKQANRSRLTEAYMSVHAYTLINKENIDVAATMYGRGLEIVEGRRQEEITRAIELLYLHVNAFYLEWNYRNAYELPMCNFYQTFDHQMRGLANNNDPYNRHIVDNFSELFSDFPEGFRLLLTHRLHALRKTP